MRRAAFAIAGAILMAVADVPHARDGTVLAANYDVVTTIDAEVRTVHSRALVRSGNEIPIVLQDYKVGLRVTETASGNFSVQVVVYEKNGSDWYQITVPPPEFSGKLGIPTEYTWESGGIELDLAIVVGIHKH